MKRKVITVLAVIVLLAGISIFLLPTIFQWYYNQTVTEYIERFEEDTTDPEDNGLLEALYQKLLAENQKLFDQGQSELKDPFSYETPGIDLMEYGLKDNSIGYLVIPKIDERLPVYLGASEENMKKGAVHLTETSYPIGGVNTNSVIAAHRGYYRANMFKNIDRLQVGDEMYIQNFRETLHYKVVETTIIMPDEVDKILIQDGRDMVTLLSCHPYGQNKQRYVVYCERDER